MMPYTVQALPDQPVILVVITAEYQPSQHLTQIIETTRRLCDVQMKPILLLINLTVYQIPSLEHMMLSSKLLAYGPQALFHHPKIDQIVIVTQDPLTRAAFAGMRSPTYGNLNIQIFNQFEQARAYCHLNG